MGEALNVLNLDGIPSTAPRNDGKPFFQFDPQGVWRSSAGDGLDEVEAVCVRLHQDFRRAIMKGVAYEQLLMMLPQFVSIAGHNSEAPLSKALFEQFLAEYAGFPEINRFLYLYDCQRLVSSIQECTKEVVQIQGEFFQVFNMESFFYPLMKHEDGTRYSTSPIVTKLFAYLSFIFIRLHSLLDYTVKVAMEAENLRSDFKTYPKMSSLSLQYGDRKRVSFNGAVGTLFEGNDFLMTVETLRNHIIHDGLLDDMPKAYEVIKDGVAIEKFVLMPDMTNGRFDRSRNRNLFYGGEDRINLRLPDLVREFMNREVATLLSVREGLEKLA